MGPWVEDGSDLRAPLRTGCEPGNTQGSRRRAREDETTVRPSPCPRCKRTNPSDSTFCRRCGLQLEMVPFGYAERAMGNLSGETITVWVEGVGPLRAVPLGEKLNAISSERGRKKRTP